MRPATRPRERPVVEGGFQVEYSTGILSFIALVGALIDRDNSGRVRILIWPPWNAQPVL